MEQEEHKMYHRRLAYIATALILILFIGAIFYHNVEKWRFLDALYFSAYTITTVGYGDFTPKTDFGKIFTIFYMFTGVGMALYGLSIIAGHFLETREEFWLQRFGKLRVKHHAGNIGQKIRKFFTYDKEKLTKKSAGDKKKV